MRNSLVILFCFLCGLLLMQLSRCKTAGTVSYTLGQTAFEKLSDYKFFSGNIKDLEPNERVLRYDLNSSLFSDYAYKARFVWVPDGNKIKFSRNNVFDFPKGSILIKNFYYPEDFRNEDAKRKIIETRLLIHENEGWIALPYIWNEEQTEATLSLAGGNKNISWIHTDGSVREINYSIPDKNQCKNCHQYKQEIMPIGPKARNLDKKFPYKDGSQPQLREWIVSGIMEEIPDTATFHKLADYNDISHTIENRAIAYLEINCGHCHNPFGSGHTSGLNLTLFEKDPAKLGICKSPVSAGKGTGGFEYDIVPGEADSSILVYRMVSNDPSVMMPEIGRKIAHAEGIDIIRQWVNSMSGTCDQN